MASLFNSPTYKANKTGIVYSPKGEKVQQKKEVLYISFSSECPLFTDGRNIILYIDIVGDVLYELGVELALIGKVGEIEDKRNIIEYFGIEKPAEYENFKTEINNNLLENLSKEVIPSELTIHLPENYVNWLIYNSNPSLSKIGESLKATSHTITLAFKDLYTDYISPQLTGALRPILNEYKNLFAFSIIDFDEEKSILIKEISSLSYTINYYPYNKNWIQCELGYLYYNGIGCEKNYKISFSYFLKSANQGNAIALWYIGVMYQYGLGTSINAEEAFQYYKKSAEEGNLYGMQYLANCYDTGFGVAKNEIEAFNWYLKAANAGNNDSYSYVAKAYFYGIGTTVNYENSLFWAEKVPSSSKNYAESQYISGCVYFWGKAGDKNYRAAASRLANASNKGFAKAHVLAGDAIETLADEEGNVNSSIPRQGGFEYYYRGYTEGDVEATFKTAAMLRKYNDNLNWNRYYRPQDCPAAYEVLRPLADAGNPEAQYLFAKYNFEHNQKETPDTRKYLNMAIVNGYPPAKEYMTYLDNIQEKKECKGIEYYKLYLDIEEGIKWITGEYGTRDYAKAASLLIAGARKGLPRAISWLCLIFIKSNSPILVSLIDRIDSLFVKDFYKSLRDYLNPESFDLSEIDAQQAIFKHRGKTKEELTEKLRNLTDDQLERYRHGACCKHMALNEGKDGDYYAILGYFEMNCSVFGKGLVGAIDNVELGAQFVGSNNFANFVAGMVYQHQLGGRDNAWECFDYYSKSTIGEALLFSKLYTNNKTLKSIVMNTGYMSHEIVESAKTAAQKGSSIGMLIFGKYLIEHSFSGEEENEEGEKWLRSAVRNSEGNQTILSEGNKILSKLNKAQEFYPSPSLVLCIDERGLPYLKSSTQSATESTPLTSVDTIELPYVHGFIFDYEK